jgi:hypothetical protein
VVLLVKLADKLANNVNCGLADAGSAGHPNKLVDWDGEHIVAIPSKHLSALPRRLLVVGFPQPNFADLSTACEGGKTARTSSPEDWRLLRTSSP